MTPPRRRLSPALKHLVLSSSKKQKVLSRLFLIPRLRFLQMMSKVKEKCEVTLENAMLGLVRFFEPSGAKLAGQVRTWATAAVSVFF